MRLLIDANIILDVLQKRDPFLENSSVIWKLCETNFADGFVSSLTFANLVYIMRKTLNPEKIETVLRFLSLIFHFVELSENDLFNAAALHWIDFEDALQAVTAKRIQADYIVTRNSRDFKGSLVKAVDPTELTNHLTFFHTCIR